MNDNNTCSCSIFGNGDGVKKGIEWKGHIDHRINEVEKMIEILFEKMDKRDKKIEENLKEMRNTQNQIFSKLSWIHGVVIGIGAIVSLALAFYKLFPGG